MIKSLSDLLPRFRQLGQREAFRQFNGFRSWGMSYKGLLRRSGGCARYFGTLGIDKADRILLWGENRAEWAVAFWAAVARGIQVVPIDFNSSPTFVERIQRETQPKLIVCGDEVDPTQLDGPKLSYKDIQDFDEADLEPVQTDPDDIVEIVYTSGTTTQPKGVVLRHRNICANLTPFLDEFHRYRLLAAPFQPIRVLNLLPLSHMFGQAMGLFIPLLMGGTCVFTRGVSPANIVTTIGREKVSVLVAVPRIVEQLQRYVRRNFSPAEKELRTSGLLSVLERWLRHRNFHSSLGWKFWAIVVGGAPLSVEIERFWSSLGVLIVQGYGLTEASPIVSLNHPFSATTGSIGKPLSGQEVRIAGDGEILIRGENVVAEYVGGPNPEAQISRGGWLHTGDLGEFDEKGNLRFKGRKADIIVTSEGLNVHPQDVEQALNSIPEVSACVVVGLEKGDGPQVHAVLILRNKEADLPEIISTVNRKLESYQRIRSWSLWPEADFPRTPSTLKVNRRKIVEKLRSGSLGGNIQIRENWLPGLLEILSAKTPMPQEWNLSEDHHLENDLGLSSLERIELFAELQELGPARLDETTFAQFTTVGDIAGWLKDSTRFEEEPLTVPRPATPRWTRWLAMRALRNAAHLGIVLPLFRRFITLDTAGLEQLGKLTPPVVFAANHNSNLDTIAILASLPYKWRNRLAPAVRLEYFAAHFRPADFSLKRRVLSSFEYYLAGALFNTFPIPQKMEGVQRALMYAGELIEAGNCPLIFPEGGRSPDGALRPFMPGVGVLATRLEVPVVPVHLGGLFEIFSRNDTWPKPGACTVKIGSPLVLDRKTDFKKAAEQIEDAVRKLASGIEGEQSD